MKITNIITITQFSPEMNAHIERTVWIEGRKSKLTPTGAARIIAKMWTENGTHTKQSEINVSRIETAYRQ